MEGKESEFETIRSRPAKSGNCSYGDSVIIRETSKSRVLVTPFFIHRTSNTELAIRIATYGKVAGPQNYFLRPEKTISMGEEASRKLLHSLTTHLQVAEAGEDGSFLVIKVAEGTAQLRGHDPSQVAQALTKVLGQPKIVEHLQSAELSTSLLAALRLSIRLNEMKTAVASLRTNLDSGVNDEPTYQKWCETHSWAFGSAYVMRDEVRNISATDKLDMLLPTAIAGFRDIVELKRPDMPVLNWDGDHRNFYFSAEVSKAIGQCHRYLDVLHEAAANGLRDHPEVVAYHPRAIVVVGRSTDWSIEKLKALHGLNRRLSGILVMTYDQLLSQGERLLELLGAPPEPTDHDIPPEPDWSDFDFDDDGNPIMG